MATTKSLLGLVTQLQSFETSLVTVLVETVLKLSSLAEFNVFFLIENADGRVFAGNDHLCQAYNFGVLQNTGADVELECDPFVSSIRQKCRQENASQSGTTTTPTSTPRNISGKRSADASAGSSLVSKRFKRETPDSGSGFDDDGNVLILDTDDDLDAAEKGTTSLVPAPIDGVDADCFVLPAENHSVGVVDFSDDGVVEDDSRLYGDVVSWVEDFLVDNEKFRFVTSIDDSAEFSRNSMARKVLDSAIYELGKEAALRFPFDGRPDVEAATKEYLDGACDRWCRAIPNFERLRGWKVDCADKSQRLFKRYVRWTMRKSYGTFRKKRVNGVVAIS